MKKPQQIVQMILAFAVMIIGLYMLLRYSWPEPPALSGLGFLLIGFALWVPHCLILKLIFRN